MKLIKRIVVSLLISVLLFGLLPSALAVGDDDVLDTVSHTEAATVTLDPGVRDITLLVRNSHIGDTLDLTNGLDVVWGSEYAEVVATPGKAAININDTEIVVLTVTYVRNDDTEHTPRETSYNIRAKLADKIDPVFSGSITKNIPVAGAATFSAADFTANYTPNDSQALGAVSLSGSNPSFGSLKLNGKPYTLGTPINMAAVSQLRFSALSAGTVSYNVKAYAGADIVHPIGNVVLTITASVTEPTITSPINENIAKGTVKLFDASYFTSHSDINPASLVSVEITPVTSPNGAWYLGTKAFTTVKTITVSELPSLSFAANTAGTVTFSWRITTDAGTSQQSDGTFTITSTKLILMPYSFDPPFMRGGKWYISSSHFEYAPLTAAMTYVKLTAIPPSSDATMYLTTALPKNDIAGYPAIAANAPLTAGAVIPVSYLDELVLVTKVTSKNAAVSYMWAATADVKVSTAVWADAVTNSRSFIAGGSLPDSQSFYETDINIPLPLAAEQIKSNFEGVSGQQPSYVMFTIPDKSIGTLYLNYDMSKKTGTAVTATGKFYAAKTPNLANITFVPAQDYTGNFEISYNAYTESGSFITGTLRFRVNSNEGGTLSYITDKNSPVQFDAKDFQTAFLSATGKPLTHVSFYLPASNHGTLYYDYKLSGDYASVVPQLSSYFVNTPQYLSLVTFVPYSNFKGPTVINYIGYSDTGSGFLGKLYIFVADSPAGIVRYSVKENSSVALSGADFSDEFIGVTGSLMSYVTFTPPVAAIGTLYYQYDPATQTGTKVAGAIKYYAGKTPDISDITFVPAKDFSGVVTVPYTATSSGGISYAGKLKFSVYEGAGVISYTTENGAPLTMDAGDFLTAFAANSGGKALSYVTFDIPSSSYGKFYYNYTSPTKYDSAVTADKKYYVSSSPYLSNVSFVPQESYNGSFTVTYKGYTSAGASVTGKIKITVIGAQSGSVAYETNSSTPVTFNATDFITAFTRKSSTPLSYARFTLPNTSYGILYYGYNPQSSNNTSVSQTSNYSASQLSSITFVPNPGYSGTLAIGYTVVDTNGYAYTDTLLITVKSSEIGTLSYDANMNSPLLFDSDDFNTAFLEKTGSALYAVSFTLPSSTSGTLYLGYVSPSSYTSKVTASDKFYRTFSPLLSNVSFVPSSSFYGAVTISYTAYTANNTAYHGKITINVGTTIPFNDMDTTYKWAKEAVSYLFRNGIVSGTGNGKFSPSVNISRGDFVLMVANAFSLTNTYGDNFPDVPANSYYYDAIAAAKALGIVSGSGGNFSPQTGLTRQDAMVIIMNTLDAVGLALSPGSTDDLSGFSDAAQVSDYAVSSVGALVRAGLVSGSGGKLNPKSMISRAEMATILYNVLTM